MTPTDADPRSDAALVGAHLAGECDALAGIYDRYADSLFDTAAAMLRDHAEAADAVHDVIVLAAERLDQLRDPSRLRPWLFAILRNQVYTRTKRRSRTRPVDMHSSDESDMAPARMVDGDHGGELDASSLATLVRDAAAGLDERDQLVLEYSVRQELAGDDLAAALGVSLDQSYVLVHRMRERVERALGALTVARMGRKECDELGDVLRDWDGTFSVLVRKRVARHVEHCDVCSDTKRRFAALSLVGAAPAFVAPAELRDRVLATIAGQRTAAVSEQRFGAAGGFPSMPTSRSRVLVVIALVAAIVALIVGVGVGVAAIVDGEKDAGPISSNVAPAPTSPATIVTEPVITDEPVETTEVEVTVTDVPTTEAPSSTVESIVTTTVSSPPQTPPPPLAAGRLTLSTSAIDFGVSGTSANLVVANTGGQPVQFAVGGAGGGFSIAPASGSLAPGASATLTVAFDRSGLGEGAANRSVSLSSSGGGGGVVQLSGSVDRPPTVRIVQPPPQPVCPEIAVPTVVAEVVDSTISSAQLSWTGPGPGGAATMSRSGNNWSAPLALTTVEGTWTLTVTAVDAAGHSATRSASFVVDCPTPG